jgi:hypothetical protein
VVVLLAEPNSRQRCLADYYSWVSPRPTSSCQDSLGVVAVAADAKLAALVEVYRSRSLEEQCRFQARSVGLHSVSACWQVNLCEAGKAHLKSQLPSSRLQHHPYSSSTSVASPHVLCTAIPCSAESPATPSRFQFWRHSCSARDKHCGNRSGRAPHARNGGLGLRCSVGTTHVSDHSGLRQATTPNPPGPRNRSQWSKSDSIRRRSSAWTTPEPFADSCWSDRCDVRFHALW